MSRQWVQASQWQQQQMQLQSKVNQRFNQDPNKNHRNQLTARWLQSPNKLKIQAPIHIELGAKLSVGEEFYANAGVCILDSGGVEIGQRVFLGPNVQIYSVNHPLKAEPRHRGLLSFEAVKIEDDVWIGGAAVICPGVHVGVGAVVAAGSVVVHDVPAGVLVAGNPAVFVKKIEDAD